MLFLAKRSSPCQILKRWTRRVIISLVTAYRVEEHLETVLAAVLGYIRHIIVANDACFLARAEHRRGNPTAALQYLEQARKLDPGCHLTQKVGLELGRASDSMEK